jgi:hypothetical protein
VLTAITTRGISIGIGETFTKIAGMSVTIEKASNQAIAAIKGRWRTSSAKPALLFV